MFDKIKRTPKGMISTEGLVLGIIGDIELTWTRFSGAGEIYLKQDIALVKQIKNKDEILFKNIFTETEYTFRKFGSPNNINYINHLPFTQEFITMEEAKELYLKSKELFFEKPEHKIKNFPKKEENVGLRPKKSKLRQRRYIIN